MFFNVIHEISRSRETNNHWFWPELSVSGLCLKIEITHSFEMMHKACCSINEVPCCYYKSSIKIQGHTGWKINDLNPIWIRLLGRLQLSNPSDLPCFIFSCKHGSWYCYQQCLAMTWTHSSDIHSTILSLTNSHMITYAFLSLRSVF